MLHRDSLRRFIEDVEPDDLEQSAALAMMNADDPDDLDADLQGVFTSGTGESRATSGKKGFKKFGSLDFRKTVDFDRLSAK